MDGTVLIADDDRTIRTVLTQAMTRAGAQVHATSSLTTLMRWVADGRGDLVVTDVAMPDGNGIEMMPRIAELRPGMPVIVISAQNTIMTAIRANEAEAWDYLPKPFDLPDLMHRVARALAETQVRRTVSQASAQVSTKAETPAQPAPRTDSYAGTVITQPGLPGPGGDGLLSGRSPAMQQIYQQVARVMNTTIPVLISGASGSGKNLIAHSIHGYSERCDAACLVLDPTVPGDSEAERKLLAGAEGGTLIIQDPGDFSPEEQSRLNRFLSRIKSLNEADMPRLIATSQHDLGALMREGRFRTDLYYRLNGIELPVPALSERVEDIPLLAEAFLRSGPGGAEAAAAGSSGTARALTTGAEDLLCRQSWPGNVRQLKNLIERLAATSGSAVITAEDVSAVLTPETTRSGFVKTSAATHNPAYSAGEITPASTPVRNAVETAPPDQERLADSVFYHLRRYFDLHQGALPPAGLYQRILREIEVPLFEIALEATQGNQARCAALLGINRNTLRKKLTALDINVTRGRKMM